MLALFFGIGVFRAGLGSVVGLELVFVSQPSELFKVVGSIVVANQLTITGNSLALSEDDLGSKCS